MSSKFFLRFRNRITKVNRKGELEINEEMKIFPHLSSGKIKREKEPVYNTENKRKSILHTSSDKKHREIEKRRYSSKENVSSSRYSSRFQRAGYSLIDKSLFRKSSLVQSPEIKPVSYRYMSPYELRKRSRFLR